MAMPDRSPSLWVGLGGLTGGAVGAAFLGPLFPLGIIAGALMGKVLGDAQVEEDYYEEAEDLGVSREEAKAFSEGKYNSKGKRIRP